MNNLINQQRIKQQFLARGVQHLHYMAPLSTMYLIFLNGILSYNKRQEQEKNAQFAKFLQDIGSKSIADPHVQFRRDRWHINGRNLHDYVPLYMGIHTPMQYVITRDNFDEQATMIAFAEVSTDKVFDIEGICYTDGNAASSKSNVYTGFDGIDKIKWDIVLTVKECWSTEYKLRKCAEVLVPGTVPASCIDRYIFMTQKAADDFCRWVNFLIEKGEITDINFSVVYDESYFYSLRQGKLKPNG